MLLNAFPLSIEAVPLNSYYLYQATKLKPAKLKEPSNVQIQEVVTVSPATLAWR